MMTVRLAALFRSFLLLLACGWPASPSAAQSPEANLVGVLPSEGIVQKPANLFDLEGKTLRFTPDAGGAYSLQALPSSQAGALLFLAPNVKALPETQPDLSPKLDLQLGHRGPVKAVAFSRDGRTLATGSYDDTLRFWDVTTGELQQTLTENTWNILTIAFHPDGRTFATGSGGPVVKLWDARTRRVRQELEGHGKAVLSVQFSPDGKRLASGSGDQTVRLWDAVSGTLQRTLTAHTLPVTSVAFSPDSRTVASGSFDGTIRLWDAQTGDLRRTLEQAGRVFSVAYSRDGKLLASSSEDGAVRVWDAQTGEARHVLKAHEPGPTSVLFSPDGSVLASSGDSAIKLWNAQTGALRRTLTGHRRNVLALALSPDGRMLASGGGDKTVRLWDMETGEARRTLGRSDWFNAVAYSRDGNLLVSGSQESTVQLWDARTGALRRTLAGHRGPVRAVAVSPDGGAVASASWDNTVRLWNAQTGELQRTLAPHFDGVHSVAFAPDGRTLACADKGVRLWDASTGELQRALTGGQLPIQSVAFSPDGRTLAGGGNEKTVWLWDAQTGALRHTLTGHQESVNAVAFSPDGKTLASASWDNTIRLWDAATGALRRTLTCEGSGFLSVSFSPDGKLLAAGAEYVVRLWDVESGELRRSLPGYTLGVHSVVFSPDGRTLATGGYDTTIKLWNAREDRLLVTLLTLPSESMARPITADARPLPEAALCPSSSEEYLALTPEGYYIGSPAAARIVRFRLGNDVFAAECFQARYHRPDLVRQALAGGSLPPIRPFHGVQPPVVGFASPRSGDRIRDRRLQITLEATDDSDVREVTLFVNGTRVEAKPITADARPITADSKPIIADSKPLPSGHTSARRFTLNIALPPNDGQVQLQAVATDDDGLQSSREQIFVTDEHPEVVTGRLMGLCVGVSRYADPQLNLRYADRDAAALAELLNRQRGIYKATQVAKLTNEQASRENVFAALDQLTAQVTKADTVIFFLSGHGWRSGELDFYFATHEVDLRAVAQTALPWRAVVERLARLSERSRRVIVLLDACHSGSAATNEDLVKAVLSANAGVLVFASSRGSEVSLEPPELGQGAFTKALLEGLSGRAAPANKKSVALRKLVDYVQDRVLELTRDMQHPQVPYQQDFDTDAVIAMKP